MTMTPETYHYLFGNMDLLQALYTVALLTSYTLACLITAGWCFYKLIFSRK